MAGSFPDLGQVQALERGALVRPPVTDEGHRDVVGALHLGRKGRTADQGRAASDDAVGTHHALVQIGDVHGAALPVADPGPLAVDLGHHGAHVYALGDAVTVAAVRGGDLIAFP